MSLCTSLGFSLDFGPARDERSPERSDADGGSRGRDNSGHAEEIHCLLQNVSLDHSL